MTSVRNDFKKKVLTRIVAEMPDDFPICMPHNPTEKFVGEEFWAKVQITHAPSRQRSHGGKGSRRYVRTGTITIRVHLPVDQGSKQMDELTETLENMFEGRNIDGIASSFPSVECREAGKDDAGRYNILLCVAVFEYRQKK